jgi:ferredoxin/flavodoxin
MSIDIYYFSGTGNSLFVAKEIALRTNGRLLSIPTSDKEEKIHLKSDSIGIVFPCYLAQLYGIPLVVERFIKKLENLESKYIFAVCTCGGYTIVDSLPTLKRLASLIKTVGGNLSAEFSVRMPMNNLNYFFFQTHDHNKMFRDSEAKILEISERIMAGKRNSHYSVETLFNVIMTPLYLILRNFYIKDLRHKAKVTETSTKQFRILIPMTDKSISVNEKCGGCSTCAKVCPVQNIMMVNNRPVWQNRCEMCMACVAWCPKGAIHHWNIEAGKKYHHPQVSLKDMLTQSDLSLPR